MRCSGPRRPGRRIIIRPITARDYQPADKEAAKTGEPTDEPVPNTALLQALADIGGENPERTQLASLDTGPQWVHVWHRWAKHLHRGSLTNPIGTMILKPERGDRPPGKPLRSAEEQIQLIHWTQDQKHEDEGEDMEEQAQLEPEADDVSAEA